MTKDEALNLALQALEEYTSVVTSVNDPNTWIKVADGGKPAREAITAIKEALAQPEHIGFIDSKLNPIQRTWVGLTDQERQDIALEVPIDAVSITEAKLKEKNT